MNRAEEFRYLILAAQREGNRLLAEALRPLGLTPAQAEVLRVLSVEQPLTLMNLGERLVCENGSPSRLVSGMVDAGWILRETSPQDKRAVLLRLSEKAEAVMPALLQVEKTFHDSIEGLLAQQTGSEALIEILWRFVENSEPGTALHLRKKTVYDA